MPMHVCPHPPNPTPPPSFPRYANRACHIKNTPLPNKFTMLEEDLLPSVPMNAAGGLGLVQLQVSSFGVQRRYLHIAAMKALSVVG